MSNVSDLFFGGEQGSNSIISAFSEEVTIVTGTIEAVFDIEEQVDDFGRVIDSRYILSAPPTVLPETLKNTSARVRGESYDFASYDRDEVGWHVWSMLPKNGS